MHNISLREKLSCSPHLACTYDNELHIFVYYVKNTLRIINFLIFLNYMLCSKKMSL